MPRLDNSSRDRAVGMLELGASQADVARRFGVSRMTISRLWRRFQTTNSTADRPRSGRPRVTTPRQDRMIRLRHLRNRTEPLLEFQDYVESVAVQFNDVYPLQVYVHGARTKDLC